MNSLLTYWLRSTQLCLSSVTKGVLGVFQTAPTGMLVKVMSA